MTGGVSTSWPITLVFFKLMVRQKSMQAWESLSKRHWRSCSVCDVTAASSAKSRSLIRTSCILVFAISLARLNSLPSDLVCRYTTSVEVPKACFSTMEKKMLKRVGARTQPCFTPLLTSKGSDMLPSYCTVALMSSWNDLIILCSFGGHPIISRMLKSPSLLTRSTKVRSTKATYKDFCCSLHFSCSWRREKIMSTFERSARKPHWDSG